MNLRLPPAWARGPRDKFVKIERRDFSQAPGQLWKRLRVRVPDYELVKLETLEGFRPGGYHPIHLHDELHDGRYRVVHKLGHGGFGTVWLCRDCHAATPTYVAIKILVANQTEKDDRELLSAARLANMRIDDDPFGSHIVLPRTHFFSHSPNGTHRCLVYPVLGPPVHDAAMVWDGDERGVALFQEAARQAVGTLEALHSRGICHGDFRPGNILLGLRNLDGLDEEQVLQLLGEPETTEIFIRKDSQPTPDIPYAPRYLVYPVSYVDVDEDAILPHIHVIDFGQSFDTTRQPLPAAFGIPANYAAPEVVLDQRGDVAMDLWSLGCTLYELRLGRRLFDVFQTNVLCKQHYVDEVASVLGGPPEPWDDYYTGEDDDSSCSDTTASNSTESSGDEVDGEHNDGHRDRVVHALVERLALCPDCPGTECSHPRFQGISEAEAIVFADLLEQLLRYRPEDRLQAQNPLMHPWFHTRS